MTDIPTKNRLHKPNTFLFNLSDVAKKRKISFKKSSARWVRPFGEEYAFKSFFLNEIFNE